MAAVLVHPSAPLAAGEVVLALPGAWWGDLMLDRAVQLCVAADSADEHATTAAHCLN